MIHETTCDPIARGRLFIRQPKKGYRFNVDSVILAGFSLPSGRRVCDLGTGTGIIGLWLAMEGAEHVTGVELQPELAELAQVNASHNGLERIFRVVREDLRCFSLSSADPPYDQVVCNPPFSALGSGRVDADPQRAMARHEIAMRLPDVFTAARRLLRPGGKLCLIHRADREKEIIEASFATGMILARMRRVLTRVGQPPSRLLIEAISQPEQPSEESFKESCNRLPMTMDESLERQSVGSSRRQAGDDIPSAASLLPHIQARYAHSSLLAGSSAHSPARSAKLIGALGAKRRSASNIEVRIEPELIVHDEQGGYASEVASLLGD